MALWYKRKKSTRMSDCTYACTYGADGRTNMDRKTDGGISTRKQRLRPTQSSPLLEIPWIVYCEQYSDPLHRSCIRLCLVLSHQLQSFACAGLWLLQVFELILDLSEEAPSVLLLVLLAGGSRGWTWLLRSAGIASSFGIFAVRA